MPYHCLINIFQVQYKKVLFIIIAITFENWITLLTNANSEVYCNTCRDQGTLSVYMTTWAMCMWVHVSTKNISVYVSITLSVTGA